jgi:2-succinyl-5-enolpyruvyl-6-hydroxy-3-cyclohexene-1-carboxylate synthase
MLEELRRLGVKHVCIAPGSRSTPLVLGAEQAGLNTFVHHDERGLGYFALGLYKATRTPIAIITTSGTAVSNLLPAATEAFHSHCPLIFLTADRPFELHNVGANQAIEQSEIFKGVTATTLNLPPPCADLPIESVLSAIDEAYTRAVRSLLPVQINCQFREPLVPPPQSTISLTPIGERWLQSGRPYVSYKFPKTSPHESLSFTSKRPLILIGPGMTPDEENQLDKWAQSKDIPVAVDVQSHLRGNGKCLRYTDWTIENLPSNPDSIFWFGRLLENDLLCKFPPKEEALEYLLFVFGWSQDSLNFQAINLPFPQFIHCH